MHTSAAHLPILVFSTGNAKTDFTFFGPSACSVDTGIVVSVYLPVALDRDQFNLTTQQTAFYYYDHMLQQTYMIAAPRQYFR